MANIDGRPPADVGATAVANSIADPAASTRGQPAAAVAPTGTARYALGEEIARGGMGVIYRATDTALSREVAVKVLHEKYGADSQVARRFADEARITAQLQHPAIPPVHDLGTLPDGRPFLAMKLIKGQTLEHQLEDRPDPSADRGRFVAVFEQVCQALGYAHSHGVIHRDLKPANVMVGAFGEVQVMDWGLAKVLGAQAALGGDPEATTSGTQVGTLRATDGTFTQAGSILGTPSCMPPEQAVGAIGKVDARSDVFGLGAILAVLLTGKPPFAAASAETIRVKAAQGDVADCLARLDGCGAEPELVALCKQCLSPRQDDRPADASVVARAVADLRAAADERARRAELDRVRAEADARAQRQRRRAQLTVAAGLLGLVVLVGGALLVVRGQAAARRADADASASVALGRAEQLAGQAAALDPATPAEAKAAMAVWEQAEAAVAQAESAVSAASPQVAGRVSEKAREVGEGLTRARRDAALLQGLATVGKTPVEQKGGLTDRVNQVGVFRSALAAAGLPAQPSGAEGIHAAGASIRAERPGVRKAITSALTLLLDSVPARGLHADFEFAAWLEVMDRYDDNAFRREVRGKLVQASIEYGLRYKNTISPLAPRRAEPPVGPADLIGLAQRAEKEDVPADAVILLSSMEGALPNSPDATARLGQVLAATRDRHPNDPDLLSALGQCMIDLWLATKDPRALAEALASYRAFIALRPDDAMGYYLLGGALGELGDHKGAAAACRASLALNPKMSFARNNLAVQLLRLGDLDGAIATLREARQIDPNFEVAHDNLATFLSVKGDLAGAIAEYKELIRLYPQKVSYPQKLTRVERMQQDLSRLPAILAGRDKPNSPAEGCTFAELCSQPFQKRYAQGARLYAEAFAGDPKLLDDWQKSHVYNATCCAVRAAQGDGVDAPAAPGPQSALRSQALGWLRGFLALRQRQATSDKPADRQEAAWALQHWLGDPDLAGVRDAEPLAKLPAAERAEWEKLWVDVKATLADAKKPARPTETGPGKK
jgi:Flp pilus assembly protein TadD